MTSSFRRVLGVAGLALVLIVPSTAWAESFAAPERPVVIDPRPDWSTQWARKVCGFARSLATYDPSFRGGAEAICAFVFGTE